MAVRKQSRRGVRKPNPSLKKVAEPAILEPWRIVGELRGVRRNAKGEIVGEEAMGPVDIFAANFGRVQGLVDDAYKAAKESAELERKAMEAHSDE